MAKMFQIILRPCNVWKVHYYCGKNFWHSIYPPPPLGAGGARQRRNYKQRGARSIHPHHGVWDWQAHGFWQLANVLPGVCWSVRRAATATTFLVFSSREMWSKFGSNLVKQLADPLRQQPMRGTSNWRRLKKQSKPTGMGLCEPEGFIS